MSNLIYPPDFMKSQVIGANIKRLRIAQSRTQDWLALQIGMKGKKSSSYICRLESGATVPLVDTLGKIAKALGVTIDQLTK